MAPQSHSFISVDPLFLSPPPPPPPPPPPHFLPCRLRLHPHTFSFPKLPFAKPRNTLPLLSCTSPQHQYQHQEQELLQFVANSTDSTPLPCVRTFENDLARLTLVGPVAFQQALAAAAADGGRVASEHLSSGIHTMVVETVFPGPSDDPATVSTRLFLPAKKVKEKAGKLKRAFGEELLSGNTSENMLAFTFRQVVMQQLWSFEVSLFQPGTQRDMQNLENLREVPVSFSVSASDEHVLSVLAEAVCVAVLQNTESHFVDEFLGKMSGDFLRWFRKPKRFASNDSSVFIYKLFEDEIIDYAKSLLEDSSLVKKSFKGVEVSRKYDWWTPVAQSKLENIGGPDFGAWTSEHVPAFRLLINADKLLGVKFEGWRESEENRWEVLLTHSQMVRLAEILDIYYEDVYSLPNKELSCGTVPNFTNLPDKKKSFSLMNAISVSVATGIFLFAVSAVGQFCLPRLLKEQKWNRENPPLPSSQILYAVNESLEFEKLQGVCFSTIKKLKDAFGWSGDIMTDVDIGSWIGEIPSYLKLKSESNSSKEESSRDSALLQETDADAKSSTLDIASYQVVLSTDGRIVGFQPTSRVGVNHWAKNPLAKELYRGGKLSPGLIEPGLKIPLPDEIVVIELLISVNSDTCFALARPVR